MASTKRKTTSGSRSGSRKRAPAKKTASGAKKRSASRNTKEERMEPAIKKELVILVSLAIAVLLFCSNLHWCGSMGETLYRIMRGLFGILAYIVPVYLFLCVCFLLSNKGSGRAVLRTIVSFLVLVVICGITSLLAMKEFDSAMPLGDYYMHAAETFGGGLFGGLCCKLLYPGLGMVGSYVILILLAAAGLVFTTEKSILNPIQKSGRKVYDTAREDMARRHEIHAAKAEERKRYRAEQKVRGVSLDTSVGDSEKKEVKQPEKRNGRPNPKEGRPETAGVFTGHIQGMVEQDGADTEEAVYIDEEAEPLKASRVKRTLTELEALDREEAEEGNPLSVDYEAARRQPEFGRQFEMTGTSGLAEAGGQEETEEVQVPFEEDVKRIVTANGKVIEVENDPTEEDPLTAKRVSSGTSIFREEGSARGSSGSVRFTEEQPAAGGKQSGGEGQERAAEAVQPAVKKKPPRPYVKPPMNLLKQGSKKMKNRDAELRETAVKLQRTLQNFGVGVTVTNISCGPSVTRYELTPEQGVKVSRIVSLTDDIKLNLAAADVRIEAPIPGKSAVGIEVPNQENMTVFLRDVIESEEFKKHPSRLAFAVGRDIGGQTVVTDLARMPHLLIAGATGSGKSVCINTLIMSILYKADPAEVKLIMVDPKVVELSVYNGIPHLMIPVVTDPKKAAGALNWAVAEMTDRYKKFAELNVRDLKGYNERIKEDAEEGEEAVPLPQLVIIVDELSDLMMVAPGEVEDAICRLAQMARAAGIHLVLATQRPSVNVITGLIKANVPSRIAFSVSSGVDSRTIIDMNGAEKLLGKGDMLFYPSGYQKPVRVQGAFVSDEEVSKVVKYLTDHTDADYSQEIENRLSTSSGTDGAGGTDERDVYFADAGRFIIEKEKASIGMLQRAFKVGFNRAARIMDQLAEAGVVGEEEGTKPRKVLMTMEEFQDYLD